MAHDETMGVREQAQMAARHILVINGDPSFLNLMRDFLQDEDYNVTTTNFVPATFDQIAALQPDALIIDLAIGRRAGWELLERLHKRVATRAVPVIVVSTQPDYLERVQAQVGRYGAVEILGKPFDLADLLSLVRVALAKHQPAPNV